MIFKLMYLTSLLVMGVGSTVLVVFGIKAACNMLSDAILSLSRVKAALVAVNNFARFAELYYKALTYIPDETIRNDLRKKWENEFKEERK